MSVRIIATGQNIQLIGDFAAMAERLASAAAKKELQRGVVDAGRKMKTRVQRVVAHQMALRSGNYQSYVVANTRGVSRPALLAFDIFGVKGGAEIVQYAGLRAVKRSNRLNTGRSSGDRGEVRSGVWNNPRVFKRSFATDRGFYALRPLKDGATSKAPRIFWTYGLKPDQPRGEDGRFGSSGKRYGKVRRLFGPALVKEIPQDDSLEIFLAEAPAVLLRAIEPRLAKLMRF